MFTKINLTPEENDTAIRLIMNTEYDEMTLEDEQLAAKFEYNMLADRMNRMLSKGMTMKDIEVYVHDLWLDYQISDCTEFLIDRMSKLEKYYDAYIGNYCIPVNEFSNVKVEVMEYLKLHRDYFLMYLSVDDGYDRDYWCITNWIE